MIVLGLRVSEIRPWSEKNQQFDDIEHNVDCQEPQDPLKWEAVHCCSASFLHYPDYSFNFGYVLIGTHQVYQWSNWHRLNQRL
jgi:hypothetical protein